MKDTAPAGAALTFCGATGTVTGSKYLVNAGGRAILVDCGLFQGYKQLRLRNWAEPPFDPARLDAVILTHAHIDHSGYLPLLARKGFKGRILCSHATRELLGVMLPDAAHLQEEEARHANRHQTSKHHPALPLFDREDAARALRLVRGVDYLHDTGLEGGMRFRLTPNGHILGSACVHLHAGGRDILFSGDLGRPNDALMAAPALPRPADWLVLESTYGDRLHNPEDTGERLARIVSGTAARGGVVVIPAFAVGRAQSLLLHLYRLRQAGRIGEVPIFLNSPMAADVTAIFRGHQEELRATPEEIRGMCRAAHLVNSADESRALNQRQGPMVIISASGMATGGRVLYHLERFAPDARNTILFAGFQAGGTRGASMLAGERRIKIFGQYIPVNAEVQSLDNLSSHADSAETLDWLRTLDQPPKKVFLTHGEPAAADALRRRITETFGWDCVVPDYLERVPLDQADPMPGA